jgi:hypothetical protein
MKRLAGILVLIVGIPLLGAQTSQPPTELMSPSQITALWHWYAQSGDRLISDIRPKFRQVLDSQDKALESSLEYEIIITGNTNAFALRNGRTTITASFLQIIDSMATVMAAAQAFNKPECLGSYVEYLGEGTRNNTWLVAHGRPPKPVAMAFGYWQLRPDVCGGLTEAGFRGSQKADDLRELLIHASIVYLIGHEFCHHKFHDNVFRMVRPEEKSLHSARGMDVSREVTPSEQVAKEKRADLFGFHKMVEMDYPPIAAMPVLVFFLGVEGFSPEASGDNDQDHPSAVVRFSDMIDATKADSEFMNLIRQHHLQTQWEAFTALAGQFSQSSPGQPVQGSGGSAESFAGQSDSDSASSDKCADLADYANSATRGFTSVKGPVASNDSDEVTFRPKHGIAGFGDCEIKVYRKPGLQPSAVCRAGDSDFGGLSSSIRSCFPNWEVHHKSLSSGEEYQLTGPSGVTVRLRSSVNRIHLWIDAPD